MLELVSRHAGLAQVGGAAVLGTRLLVPQVTSRDVRKVRDQKKDTQKLDKLVGRREVLGVDASLHHLGVGQVDHLAQVLDRKELAEVPVWGHLGPLVAAVVEDNIKHSHFQLPLHMWVIPRHI